MDGMLSGKYLAASGDAESAVHGASVSQVARKAGCVPALGSCNRCCDRSSVRGSHRRDCACSFTVQRSRSDCSRMCRETDQCIVSGPSSSSSSDGSSNRGSIGFAPGGGGEYRIQVASSETLLIHSSKVALNVRARLPSSFSGPLSPSRRPVGIPDDRNR